MIHSWTRVALRKRFLPTNHEPQYFKWPLVKKTPNILLFLKASRGATSALGCRGASGLVFALLLLNGLAAGVVRVLTASGYVLVVVRAVETFLAAAIHCGDVLLNWCIECGG